MRRDWRNRIPGRVSFINLTVSKVDFLEKVARTLYDNHRDTMERQVVILPSRRAGLYLAKYLSGMSDRPQWAPMMMTVTELFASFSDLKITESETLVFDLYRSYAGSTSTPLPFDDFWSWGETILSDFNDIDLWLADPEKIYSNISDLREIDQKFGTLTEAQVEIIRSFWTSFRPEETDSEARTAFRSVWQLMGPLYKRFSGTLATEGRAWEGMLCRQVAERAMADNLIITGNITYHVAGLNALNNCEKELFLFLRRHGCIHFYWDDDHDFMRKKDHKAATFIRENLGLFGNDLPKYDEEENHSCENRWIILDTPSDTAQAKMLPEILMESGFNPGSDAADTAVILADEKLLSPVLSSLPEEARGANVTMGHPFKYTSLYSFLRQLFSLARYASGAGDERLFRAENVLAILRHQYFKMLSGDEGDRLAAAIITENMVRVEQRYLTERVSSGIIFMIPSEARDFPDYLITLLHNLYDTSYNEGNDTDVMKVDREYLRHAIGGAGRLRNLISSYNISLKTDTCIRLIDRVFRRMIVPFSGEPLKGLQIMGVLETRALEFRNVIFLSLNEGIFPNQSYENTFIPYNIRRAFGLPTINEHESIYSYHFFRLLRKPLHGWFMYNSTAQGISTGEMSRYLIQMRYDDTYSPQYRSLNIIVGRSTIIPAAIEKSQEHISALMRRYSGVNDNGDPKLISPSALNTWLGCRMKFYFRYVCGIDEEDKLEKEIDQRRFGNILHGSMEELYKPLIGVMAEPEYLRMRAADTEELRLLVIKKASEEMHWKEENLLKGKSMIIIDVLVRYISEILTYDSTLTDLVILSLEEKFYSYFYVPVAGERMKIAVGGIVDRVDSLSGMKRVVDYKTGSPKDKPGTLDDLFNEEKEKRNDAVLQTHLYCSTLLTNNPGEVITPNIYWVQQISSSGFDPLSFLSDFGKGIPRADEYEKVMKCYSEEINNLLTALFSEREPFVMTSYSRRCLSCPYRQLCQR